MTNHCEKCGGAFNNPQYKWEKGKTYLGLDNHHNPPKFMMNQWVGKEYFLCRKHHRELHDKILKIMIKHSTLMKPNKSEYWIWLYTPKENKEKCMKEVFEFTEEYVMEIEE